MADDRHPLLSGLFLLSIPLSGLISYLIVGSQNWINAAGLLLVPLSIACWIFATIRAIHFVGVRFWSIPSTFVALIGSVLALIICLIMLVFSGEAERRWHRVNDTTLYAVAAFLYGGCVVSSYRYNWRKTKVGNSGFQPDAPSVDILHLRHFGAVLVEQWSHHKAVRARAR